MWQFFVKAFEIVLGVLGLTKPIVDRVRELPEEKMPGRVTVVADGAVVRITCPCRGCGGAESVLIETPKGTTCLSGVRIAREHGTRRK